MRIAIIGAGNVGNALGAGWERAGHEVRFGIRNPATPPPTDAADRRFMDIAAAVGNAEAVVLAVPWPAVPDAIAACGDLAGRVLIDVTNPLSVIDGALRLALGFDRSGGEEVARLAPQAAVFKALNQVGFAVMADSRGFAERPTMFVAGDDEQQKPLVMALVEDLGFRAMDAGPLDVARLLEPYAALWIH